MVVVGKPTPPGPMLIVSLPITIVVGMAPIPIGYVVPLMITSVGSTVNVNPSAVTTDGVIGPAPVGKAAVVPAMPIPLGPMVKVSPFITVVMGTDPGLIVKVLPLIIASEGERENVKSPSVTTEKSDGEDGSATVVVARPTPLGPMLTVWPLMTVVIGELPGPIVNVCPPITASEAATEKVKPPAVTVEKLG